MTGPAPRRRRRLAAALVAVLAAAAACGGTTTPSDRADSPRRPAATTTSTTSPTTTAVPEAPAAAPTPAATGAVATGLGDPYFPGAGNGGYDVASYDVTMAVTTDGADHLDAIATITATATQALPAFSLDLVGLDVGAVTVDGGPAVVRREDAELVVTPSVPVPAGRTFTVVVPYSGTPQGSRDVTGLLERGGWLDLGDYSVVLAEPVGASSWLPCNDHPTDKARFRLTATVPPGLTAVSNGRLLERRDTPQGATFTWAASEPMAPYLATLAVGDLELSTTPNPGGPEIVDALPPAGAERLRAGLATFPLMLAAFSQRFGPYPWDTAGNLVVPGLPAMALETQTRALLSPALVDPSDDSVVAHELAHQWFGDAVSPATWRDVWLNEGLATWAEWWWGELAGGPTVAEQARRAHDGDPALDVPPADPGVDHLFGRSVYDRAGMFLVELQRRLGDDAFTTLLRTWVAEHRGGTASTADFLAVAGRVAGAPVDDLAQPWLYGTSLPPLTR